jgi:hypothetical protein
MKKVQFMMAIVLAILPFVQAPAQLEYFSPPRVLVPLETGKIFYVKSDLYPIEDCYTASRRFFL